MITLPVSLSAAGLDPEGRAMTPNDLRPVCERLDAALPGAGEAPETDTADVTRDLQALGATLPSGEALLLPRRRVWDRLAAEVSQGQGRARGAA